MVFKKKSKTRYVSPRSSGNTTINDSDFSSTALFYNSSEFSASTCDTIQNKRNLPRQYYSKNKKLNTSIATDEYLNSESESDDNGPPRKEKICKRCDELTVELTQLRIQNFDKWLSEIKTLEDMLYKKEAIIEEFKREVGEKDKEIIELKSADEASKERYISLENQLMCLRDQIESKNRKIGDLEYALKEKIEIISQQKKKIDKLEMLALEDSKLIMKLRSCPRINGES